MPPEPRKKSKKKPPQEGGYEEYEEEEIDAPLVEGLQLTAFGEFGRPPINLLPKHLARFFSVFPAAILQLPFFNTPKMTSVAVAF